MDNSISQKKNKKHFYLLKIIVIILAIFVALLGALIGGMNLLKYAIYSDYMKSREIVCTNPGLNDGLVCQGIAVNENKDEIFTCGYMTKDRASRIYITNSKSEERYVILKKNGKDFKGHVGGLGLNDDTFYLSNGGSVYTIPYENVVNAKGSVEIGQGLKVNGEDGSASTSFADGEYLYVAEFHDGGKYVTNHPVETKDGTYYAICSKYRLDDVKNGLNQPVAVYSIRNKVQGFCVTDEGKIVLSTSYGLKSSELFIYNPDKIVDSGTTMYDAPLYILDSYSRVIKCPPMSEDLSFKDGKVYCLNESASNKYIFGKLFVNANKIVSFKI